MKLDNALLKQIIDESLDGLLAEQTEQEIEKAKEEAADAQKRASEAAVTAAEEKADVSDLEAKKAEKEAEQLAEEQSLESLLESTMEEALADYLPTERDRLKNLAISIIRKAKESPEFKTIKMPPNAAAMVWEAAFRVQSALRKAEEKQIEKQANIFIDELSGIEGRGEIEQNVGRIEESFQIKKSRLREIVAEEVADAKKQGIL